MKKSSLLPIFAIVFVDMLGFGLILPLLPYIAESYHLNSFQVGLLLATFPIGQVFGAPILGRLSDRYGRKPILIISILGTFASFLLLGLARNILLIFASRLLDGLTGGNISVAQSYISDKTTAENRAKGLGLIGAAFGLGFIFGPAIGGSLSQLGIQAPAFLSAALSLINLVLIAAILPESLSREDRERLKDSPKTRFSLNALLDTLKKPVVGPLLHGRFYYSFAFGLFQTIFSLYAQKRLNLDARSTGFVLAYVGILVVLIQGLAIGPLTKRYSENKLIRLSSIGMSLSFIFWAVAPNLISLLIVLIPLSLTSSVLNTVLRSKITKSVRPEEIGGILGLSTSLESVTSIATPVFGGLLIGSIGTWAPGAFSALIMASLAYFMARKLKSA